MKSATGRTRELAAERLRGRPTASGSAGGHLQPLARHALRRFPGSTVRGRGFTLIEVLVVVTIAALMTALVMLRLGDWRSGAEPAEQLERIAALIDYQCEQAMFQARPRGVRLTTEGYDFWQSTHQGWAPLPEDPVARPRAWAGAFDVDLLVEQRRVDLQPDPPAPQLICHPLGELTAFDLSLRTGDDAAVLVGEPGGSLALERTP